MPGETFRAHFEDHTSELGDADLEAEDEEPDSHEDRVGKHALEHVEFVMDLARAEHVDDLEHHEGGEEEGPVARSKSWEVASSFKFIVLSWFTLYLYLKLLPDSSKGFTASLVLHTSFRLVLSDYRK